MPRPRFLIVLLLLLALTACSSEDVRPRRDEQGTTASPADGRQDGSLPKALAQAVDGRPRVATSPKELVEQVVAAERAIADASTPPDVLAAAGHLQQVAYRTLSTRPRWDTAVRAGPAGGTRAGGRRQRRLPP